MALFNLSNFGDALQDAANSDQGVSFAGLAKKWENEEDGKVSTCKTHFFLML